MAIAISFIRLLCALVIITLSFSPFTPFAIASWSSFLALIAGASDSADGMVARFWGIKSRIGAIIDQTIDKIYFYILCIFLMSQGLGQTLFYGFFWMVIILLLVRDFFLSAMRQYDDGEIFSKEWQNINKLKTFCQNGFLTMIFFSEAWQLASLQVMAEAFVGAFLFLAYVPLIPLIKNYAR